MSLRALLTEALLARGDRVAATLRQPAALDDLRAEHGDRLWTAQLDVTDTGQVHRVVDAAFAVLGPIDVVVSNAGYAVFASVEEASDATPRSGGSRASARRRPGRSPRSASA